MKKAIIRLVVQQDPDLRLMPIYFDRLKLHAKIRKLWRYLLRVMDRRCIHAADE